MRRDIEILKSIYLPEIEEMYSFDPSLKTSIQQDAFWEYFNSILFDSKEIANFLYIYKVARADYFIDRLEQRKNEYISYLASDYCNGETNPTIELLLEMQFIPFMDEVAFQKDLKKAITISENEKLKKRLSLMDEAASFEITDDEITAAFQLFEKKNEHEELKKKMREWDSAEQPVFEESSGKLYRLEGDRTSYSPSDKPTPLNLLKSNTKTISLSFIKYAAAACFVGAMIWLGIKFYDAGSKVNNTEVAKIDSPTRPVTKAKPVFAKVEWSENFIPMQTETGMGFAYGGSAEKLSIIIQNVVPRIQSIEDYLNKPQTDTSETTLRTIAREELESLRKLSIHYIFDGKKLQLFQTINAQVQNSVIKTADKKYYLMSGDSFYQLIISEQQQDLNKITDSQLIEKLERIVFDNEK
jgi:hypothetical protein